MDYKYFPDPGELNKVELRMQYEHFNDPMWEDFENRILRGLVRKEIEGAVHSSSMRGKTGDLFRDVGAWAFLRELIAWSRDCREQFRQLIGKGGN